MELAKKYWSQSSSDAKLQYKEIGSLNYNSETHKRNWIIHKTKVESPTNQQTDEGINTVEDLSALLLICIYIKPKFYLLCFQFLQHLKALGENLNSCF